MLLANPQLRQLLQPKKLSISFYPNPVTTYLDINIQSDHFADYQVSVYTVAGQLMLK